LKKSKIFVLNIFLIISLNGFFFPQFSFAADKTEKNEAPDYSSIMLINSFLPGSAQIKLGEEKEGYFYLSSIPINFIGQGLILIYFLENTISWNPTVENNKTYLVHYNNNNQDKKWMFYTGITLSIYANLLASYSSYAANRDYQDKYSPSELKSGRETLSELVTSPFKVENILNWDFFPVFPLTVISGLQSSDFHSIGNFFTKNNVPFMGLSVKPVTGFTLNLITTAILVLANAAWEEITFRGLLLEQSGITVSSLNFGLAHLGNMLLPDTSVEDTVLQTGFATLFGFYSANRTIANHYDFRRMIALHFWHNVISSSLSYMVNPNKTIFIINYSLKF
jgi:hypothetical protein